MALKVMDRLAKEFGLTAEQAAGVVGNLYHESKDPTDPNASGMNPHINEVAHSPKDKIYGAPVEGDGGYGWGQWSGVRKKAFLDFSREHNLNPGSAAANWAFLVSELKNGEPGKQGYNETIKALKSTHSASEAATTFRQVYERAQEPMDQKRIDRHIKTQRLKLPGQLPLPQPWRPTLHGCPNRYLTGTISMKSQHCQFKGVSRSKGTSIILWMSLNPY